MRIGILALAASLLAAPALAQIDDNLRRPALYEFEQDGARVQLVVGDAAWGDALGTLGILRNAEDDRNQAIIDQLWGERNENPPLFLFEVARRAVRTDPDLALEAYFLGRARTLYDSRRCVDSTALEGMGVVSGYAGQEVTDLMASDFERVAAALERVRASEDLFAATASPWWVCSFGSAAYFAAINNAPMTGPEWLKTEVLWPALQHEVRVSLYNSLLVLRAGAAAEQEN